MHVKVKNAPGRLGGRDVPTLDPSCNLVSLVTDLKASNISTLLDVFEGILEGAEGDGTFNIEMAIVFCGEVRVIGDNPRVVDLHTTNVISSAIIGSEILRVAIVIHDSPIGERFRVTFCASAIFHAWGARVSSTARSMYHTLFDGLKQKGLGLGVRPSHPNCRVNVLRSQQLLALLEKNQEMDVQKATLLKFDCIHIRYSTTENTGLVDISNNCLSFKLEHASYQIWAV
jgi:hypothetical protein